MWKINHFQNGNSISWLTISQISNKDLFVYDACNDKEFTDLGNPQIILPYNQIYIIYVFSSMQTQHDNYDCMNTSIMQSVTF